jgi:hypothetical protein
VLIGYIIEGYESTWYIGDSFFVHSSRDANQALEWDEIGLSFGAPGDEPGGKRMHFSVSRNQAVVGGWFQPYMFAVKCSGIFMLCVYPISISSWEE